MISDQSDFKKVWRDHVSHRDELINQTLYHLIRYEHSKIGVSHDRVTDIFNRRVELSRPPYESCNQLAVGARPEIARNDITTGFYETAFLDPSEQITNQFGLEYPASHRLEMRSVGKQRRWYSSYIQPMQLHSQNSGAVTNVAMNHLALN